MQIYFLSWHHYNQVNLAFKAIFEILKIDGIKKLIIRGLFCTFGYWFFFVNLAHICFSYVGIISHFGLEVCYWQLNKFGFDMLLDFLLLKKDNDLTMCIQFCVKNRIVAPTSEGQSKTKTKALGQSWSLILVLLIQSLSWSCIYNLDRNINLTYTAVVFVLFKYVGFWFRPWSCLVGFCFGLAWSVFVLVLLSRSLFWSCLVGLWFGLA